MATGNWRKPWLICLTVVAFVITADACSSSALESGPNDTTPNETTPAVKPTVDLRAALGSVDAAASSAVEAGRSTVPPPPDGWQVVFEDGFDLTQIDPTSWTVENRAATNMGEISFYSRDDAYTRDGQLVLRAQKRAMGGRQYTTAQVSSHFSFQYGRVDIRAKMPMSQGFWPALWLLPTAGSAQGFLPEIDIHESISNLGGFYANFHWKAGSAKRELGPIHVDTDATAWHVYSIEWTPDRIAWLLDDQEVASATDGVNTTNQSKMYLLITFALGGSWPGPPDQTTVFPSEMLIDWVRVAQR
jgi:beta-glucanase (GH16 family)